MTKAANTIAQAALHMPTRLVATDQQDRERRSRVSSQPGMDREGIAPGSARRKPLLKQPSTCPLGWSQRISRTGNAVHPTAYSVLPTIPGDILLTHPLPSRT
jgi:hypothetical protein